MLTAKLPVELLDIIVDLACCDGGLTARSLRLVSTQINAITDSYTFRAVYITGFRRMQAFARTFKSSPVKCQASLRHVLIAANNCTKLRSLLTGILAMISPTVQTVILFTTKFKVGMIMYNVIKLRETRFPRLTHLTLAVPMIERYATDSLISDKSSRLFPNLTHVHLAFNCHVSLQDLSRGISHLMAAHTTLSKLLSLRSSTTLKSIRISGIEPLTSPSAQFLLQLLQMVDVPNDEKVQESLQLPLPPSFNAYIIQPSYGRDSIVSRVIDQNAAPGGAVSFRVLLPEVTRTQKMWRDLWGQVQAGERDIDDDWSLDS